VSLFLFLPFFLCSYLDSINVAIIGLFLKVLSSRLLQEESVQYGIDFREEAPEASEKGETDLKSKKVCRFLFINSTRLQQHRP
jgi:hypothetical protein